MDKTSTSTTNRLSEKMSLRARIFTEMKRFDRYGDAVWPYLCAVIIFVSASVLLLIFVPSGKIDEGMFVTIGNSVYRTRCGNVTGNAFLTSDSLLVTSQRCVEGADSVMVYANNDTTPTFTYPSAIFKAMPEVAGSVFVKVERRGAIILLAPDASKKLKHTHPTLNIPAYYNGSDVVTLRAYGYGQPLYNQIFESNGNTHGAPVIVRRHQYCFAIGVVQ